MSSQLCLSTFARSKRGTTVRKSTYTDMILLVGHGVSGDFSSYFPTREWERLKTRSPFDTSSSEHSAFVTRLDLFWFPHSFVKILCSWVWFISFTRCWFVLSEEVDLDSTSLVWFWWHQPPSTTQSRRRSQSRTVTYEWGKFCDRNLSQWISEKGPGRAWGLSEEIIFVSENLFHKPLIWSG